MSSKFILTYTIIYLFFPLLTFFLGSFLNFLGKASYVLLIYFFSLPHERKKNSFILQRFFTFNLTGFVINVVSQNSGDVFLKDNDLIFFDDFYFIVFALHVFILGVFGLILSSRLNLLLFLLNFEILFLGGGLLFIGFSIYWLHDPVGQVFALFLLFLAAVDSAIGLGLFILLKKSGIDFNLNKNLTETNVLNAESDDFNLIDAVKVQKKIITYTTRDV